VAPSSTSTTKPATSWANTTGTGALIEETVWLGDIPVATLRPNGATVSVYYLHSDQLNTPREVTRPSDNKVMWTWFSDPFGTTSANINPTGAGAFAFNRRFPGQIFDGQTGLHQNGNRDYDPATGGYVESDPIGMNGGINTYAYVDQNPLAFDDRTDSLHLAQPVMPNCRRHRRARLHCFALPNPAATARTLSQSDGPLRTPFTIARPRIEATGVVTRWEE